MKLTLIITTYNWPESLLLVFESIKCQTILPYEVIIADDGSTKDTKNFLYSFKKDLNLNSIHSWQEDIGVRASRSRNKAIVKSSGDYIVLIDGDMILHKNFLQDHINNSEPGYFIQGSRVLLSEKKSRKILIDKKYDAVDALKSGFPAGTVSGAPKIRAMEIIEELENLNRSFYGGCMGYFDSNGQMDTCISLRTGLVKDNILYIQAGGGIVYDSDPEKEFEETINKANALVAAAEDSYRYK